MMIRMDITCSTLLQSQLHVKDQVFRILEVEHYQNDDPYTHHDREQYRHGTFYFHRIKGKRFKEGSFKGMDITAGSGDKCNAYLIRSIGNDTETIEGPCLVVQKILGIMDHHKVKEFHAQYAKVNPEMSIDRPDSDFYLEFPDTCENLSIHSSPRVGLKFKSIAGRPASDVLKWCMAPLRHTVIPTKLKKQKCTLSLPKTDGTVEDPAELLSSLTSWKVSDIRRVHRCYLEHHSASTTT